MASSANEQVNLGIVGCGWRGGQLAEYFEKTPGLKIAGLCDVDEQLSGEIGKKYPRAAKWTDMRRMFDSPDIDAVAIATCNHWHCLASIWAMEAGKHVYVEKPLGHTEWEGRQVVLAQQRYDRICQVGTQQRSDPLQAEIKQYLYEDQALGEIESVRINRFGVREPIGRRDQPLVMPSSVDYDLWLGPAQDQPIYRDKLHYDWHWDWNTGSGEMGNWGVHIIDDVRNNVFRDSVTAPKSIVAAGTRAGWDDAGNTPNVHLAILDADGVPVVVTLSNLPIKDTKVQFSGPNSGYVVFCSEGQLHGQRGSAIAVDSTGKRIKKFQGNNGNVHHQRNFVEAIREHKQEMLMAPARVGNDSTTWCNLINIATRLPNSSSSADDAALDTQFGKFSGRELLQQFEDLVATTGGESGEKQFHLGPRLSYDPVARQFGGNLATEANSLLRRADRERFEVPDLSAAVQVGSR
ncbi:MAG: Gfo/Idh/MocA family oxidoreductase [Planctomycetota bacterium]